MIFPAVLSVCRLKPRGAFILSTFRYFIFTQLTCHVYNLAARMRSPDLRWTMGRMTLKCIYTFAVTFSKMEKLVKFLILQ